MPYKDQAKQREAIKKAVNRHRQGITDGITQEGKNEQGITYHPIIYALTDKAKRVKLEKISQALKDRRLLDRVHYGAGVNSLEMSVVDEMLKVTA